jgi:hypothetical protein
MRSTRSARSGVAMTLSYRDYSIQIPEEGIYTLWIEVSSAFPHHEVDGLGKHPSLLVPDFDVRRGKA